MVKQGIILFFTLLLTVHPLFAAGKGTASAQFLKLGLGARAAGMGGAYSGVADEVNAIYWNPAGLSQMEHKELTLMHALWFEKIAFNYLAYSQKGLGGNIGIGINQLRSGDIDKYDNQGSAVNETYNAADMNATFSYAKKIHGLSLGLNLKYISLAIEEESTTAYAADVGAFFKLGERLGVGVVGQNMGTAVQFNTVSEPLPLITRLGLSYKLSNLLIAADVVSATDDDLDARAGLEYALGRFALRAGYKMNAASNFDSMAGVTAGFGFVFAGYGLDYAYDTFGDLGATHMLSLLMRFGVAAEQQPRMARKTEMIKGSTAASAVDKKPKLQNLAVIDFQALAPISMSEATFTTEIFRASLVQSKRYKIVDRNNMEKVLAEQGFQQTGCTTNECAVQMGKLLNVNKIVSGTFGKLGKHYLLTINVLDVQTAEIIHSNKASCKELTPDQVQGMADRLIQKLLLEVK